MDRGISKHIENGDIKIKKKIQDKKSISPRRSNYSDYLNRTSSKKKKSKGMQLDQIKLNVIKKDKGDQKQTVVPQKPSKKVVPQKQSKKTVPQKQSKKIIPQRSRVQKKKSIPTNKNTPSKKIHSKRRSHSKRIHRRRELHKKHTKSRRISFRCYPQKDNVNFDKIMKNAEKMSDENIRKELMKNGIEIKAKNNKLLKDLYMFSNMGGIRISKE